LDGRPVIHLVSFYALSLKRTTRSCTFRLTLARDERAAEEAKIATPLELALEVLDAHFKAFEEAKPFAQATEQLVPSDTKSWSQIFVCALTGQEGRSRKKGSDLADGSDVKAANCWCAIDTPRFNGCIPSGRKSETSWRAADITALDDIPYLYFVLWDERPSDGKPRCRVWCVRPGKDKEFRDMADKWYKLQAKGEIKSANFQLHPPRKKDHNIFRNECGNLSYPLMLSAVRVEDKYLVETYAPKVVDSGNCFVANDAAEG
jgi:hypothetical protein